ncbi:hypothetical protein [Sphingorhabdus sp.]|jgi:glutathione S-transferase|uniref:hypothetical protein n=1 Tax=Sphingorhabdus sp. TaxID=1902408 RepID=UPI0035B4D503|nr:hypothetical protein [Sphingomonadaceae bacterium]
MSDKLIDDDEKKSADAAVGRFCVLRSEVIDLFADAEIQITNYVLAHSAKQNVATHPLNQKINHAMKVAAGPQRSKAIKAEADAQLKAIQDLLPDRAAIVHSRMTIAECISGKFVAIFKNAKDVAGGSSNALVYDQTELEAFLDKLKLTNSRLADALGAKNHSGPPAK